MTKYDYHVPKYSVENMNAYLLVLGILYMCAAQTLDLVISNAFSNQSTIVRKSHPD